MIEFKCSWETSKKRMQNRKKNDWLVVDSRNPKKYDEVIKKYDTIDFEEIEENQSVIFTQFDSEKWEFDIINKEKLTDEMLKFMGNIKENLLETFNTINKQIEK
jgi:hypothetical protein